MHTLTINTPAGLVSALPSQAERINAMSDAELIASVDAARPADPFEFQEIFNRGLYSQTADEKRRRRRRGLCETLAKLCEEAAT